LVAGKQVSMNRSSREKVRCPSAACGDVIEVPRERLGRNVYCLTCGRRMTARPLEVADRLREKQEQVRGEAGLDVPRLPLAVLVDNIRSLWNVGSIFRTADACGVREIVLSGITGCPPRTEIAKTALGAEQVVTWRYFAEAGEALASLTDEGYTPVAVETSPGAVPVGEMEWPERTCLVIGNEVAGVSPELLEACTRHVSIPMRGVKESLNVAVAFGVVAFHAARSLERVGADRGGDRRPGERV